MGRGMLLGRRAEVGCAGVLSRRLLRLWAVQVVWVYRLACSHPVVETGRVASLPAVLEMLVGANRVSGIVLLGLEGRADEEGVS